MLSQNPYSTYPELTVLGVAQALVGNIFSQTRVSSKSSGGHEFGSHQPPRNVLTVKGDSFLCLHNTLSDVLLVHAKFRFSSQRAA